MNKVGQSTVVGEKMSSYVLRLRLSRYLIHPSYNIYTSTPFICRAAQRGMWKFGTSSETPAEYKRRYAKSGTAVGTGKAETLEKLEQQNSSSRGWFSWLWGSK